MNNLTPTKMHSDDRILVLKPMEGKNTLTNKGMIDNRIFSGENNFHIKKDPQIGFWTFQFDSGVLAPELKQQFTTYTRALNYATEYFKRRNVDVVEVKG